MVVTLLCGTTDVKRHIDTTGRWTGTVIMDRINAETDWIYQDCGYPLAGFQSPVEKDENEKFYRNYFCGESKIYNVDRVYVGTATKRELEGGIDYTVSTTKGMIILTSGGSYAGADLNTSDYLTCWYVPRVFKEYCALRVVRGLLEESDIATGENTSSNLNLIERKIKRVEDRIRERIALGNMEDNRDYDSLYEPAIKKFNQNFLMNNMLVDHTTSTATIPFQDKVTYAGSACTGADGDVNRTLTHVKVLTTGNLVLVNGLVLTENVDYTVSGAVITFLINISNTDSITVYT